MSVKNLSDEKLETYRQILLKEKEEAQFTIDKINDIQKNGMRNDTGDTSFYQIHQADMGTDTDESEKRVLHYNNEVEKIQLINEALHRIYDKSYGICEICGNYIPENRLVIIPYAKYCIDCKKKEEIKNR
jgi:RNA polymerase-binding transcription factor DksA